MRITSPAPWKNVKCSCGTGLEVDLSDIRVETVYDEDGDDSNRPFVVCPVCHHKVSVHGVPSYIQKSKSSDLSDYDL